MSKETSKTAQQRAADVLRGIAERGEGGVLRRSAEVVAVDVDARTVVLAFSSEAEVKRWFGVEVLSHAPGACDLTRLNDGGALLWNHVWDDQRGVVESAWIDADGKGRALVRLSKNQAGEELLVDLADGIKRHVSVGYFIRAVKLSEERDDGVDVYTVTSWEPYEISIVAVPADITVGVGRSAAEAATVAITAIADAQQTATVPRVRAQTNTTEEKPRMFEKITRDKSGNLVRANVDDEGNIVSVLEVLERAGDDVKQAQRNGANAEQARVRELTDLANEYGSNVDGAETMLRDALASGSTASAFQRSLLQKLNERASKPIAEQIARNDIGLTDKEQRSYSILRLVRAQLDPTDKNAQRAAAFEMEVSTAARQHYGKDTDRAVIPTDILRQSVYQGDVRAPFSAGKTGGAASGGYAIATDLHAQSFIEILRNRSTFMSMSRVLGGLVGNVDIPKQIAAASSFWLGAEDEELDETGIGLDQIVLSPKTIGSFSEITRKLLMQGSLDAEALVRADLAIAAGLGIDKAGYYGSGLNGEPLGVANVTGIHAVPFAIAGKPTFAELVAMETEISADNADVQSMALVANARFRGHAKTNRKFPDAVDGGTIWEPGNTVNGYRTEITNQIADGDVFFGNFGDTIVGLWGGLELAVDPYTHSRRGRIRLTAFQDVDFAHRRAESFALGRKVP